MNLERTLEQPWNPFEPRCCDRPHPLVCACLHENLLIHIMLITHLCPEARLGMNFRKRDVCFVRAPTSHILLLLRKLPRISTLCTLVPVAVGSKLGEETELTENPCIPVPPRPPAWKAWAATSPGSICCSRPSWSRTAVALVEKGIGFHRLCNLRQRSLAWG